MENKKIELGDKVKHIYSGFTGIAFARTTYLSGCDRIDVMPEVGKDGELKKIHQFDEPELKIVKKGNVKKDKKETGGYKPRTKHYLKNN